MTSNIPGQHGRVAVVTGANSGLGLLTTRELAGRGAHVILAVRNVTAGREVARRMAGTVEVRELNLASPVSVRAFAETLAADHPKVDLLVNNAGVMLLGQRRTSENGCELHLATNVLGPFALTGLLLSSLEAAPAARVVNLSSLTHRDAHFDFDDPMFERDYRAMAAYGRSKLAATVLGVEMARRLHATGSPVISVLAHPGMTRTNLTPNAWAHRRLFGRLDSAAVFLAGQPVRRGVLPQLHAATDPSVRGGQFFGPSGRGELRVRVGPAQFSQEATDPTVGRRLWKAAEELTGITYL